MVFFLDKYILAPFSNCFMKCELSQTNYLEKNAGVFLDFMISHKVMKQWSSLPQILVY